MRMDDEDGYGWMRLDKVGRSWVWLGKVENG